MHGLRLWRLLELYRQYPDAYADDVLHVTWWEKQLEIARALVQHRRVLVKASHSIGKTHLGGGLVNWFFDCFRPSICLTTAPTQAQVHDLLWKEVRMQRGGRPGLLPKADRMEVSPEHFAAGYTARDADSFQGRHEKSVLIIFDEATGIDGQFWDAAEGMMASGQTYWLVIMNPTDTSSRAYEEELSGDWHVITVSALDHPNIAAQLVGHPPPFPGAVNLEWVEERVRKWCTPIAAGDHKASDVEFPPDAGKWYRPGPLFEGRVLGRWPTSGSYSVWSEGVWNGCFRQLSGDGHPLEIGCDVARFGDDFTSIFVRRGPCVLHHETHNGWDTTQTAGELKWLAQRFAVPGEDPRRVEIKIDDDGVGGGVVDKADGWKFVPVSGASTAAASEDYPNRRSELWFDVAERAERGELDLTRLHPESLSLIRRQAMAPTYKLDGAGRRVVEPKEKTKERIGRSPDDMDGLNLAFARASFTGVVGLHEVQPAQEETSGVLLGDLLAGASELMPGLGGL